VTLSGLDTVSIALRPESQDWSDLLLTQAHRPGAGGALIFDRPGPGKTKLGAFGRGVFWMEGRIDAALTGSDGGWDLRPVIDVNDLERVARESFDELAGEPAEWYGMRPPAEVRRFDLAHEFAFDRPDDGLAFLRTVAGMCPPRRKLDVWTGQDGQPQTVYVRQAKSGVVTERLYDKGVESGSHPPGHRLRYEAQRRPPKRLRMRPEVLAAHDLRAEFGRSINAYVEGSESVIAAGTEATMAHLVGAAARGEISMAKAERMIGTVAVLQRYGRAVYPDVQQQQRRLRGLREVGVSLDQELPADAVVPVGKLLADAVEAFSA
jgi:hypothetical protein